MVKKCGSIFAFLGMMILILDGQTALTGARDGISLCLTALIPSLFPFFVLSILLTGALSGSQSRAFRPLERVFRVPAGCGSLILVGLLGGYPVGARNIALAHSRGDLSGKTAERMLAFCNNAGPAFLFGMIGPQFSSASTLWLLWGIHIVSAWIVSLSIAEETDGKKQSFTSDCVSFHQALDKACRTMASVCGWVVLFRVLLTFLERWILWIFPKEIRIFFTALLELSNGCVRLDEISSEGLRFVIASSVLALGGLCVAMQTKSAAGDLSLKRYFPGKILQCCVSYLLALCCQPLFPPTQRWIGPAYLTVLMFILAFIMAAILMKNEKYSSIPATVGV